jgi:hypothetical protein
MVADRIDREPELARDLAVGRSRCDECHDVHVPICQVSISTTTLLG